MKERIPKVINYCWFGKNEKSDLILKCIDSWKRFCPEYEIVEWNEDNFDIKSNDYVMQAYNNKKWAFVSDYVRLYAIYNNGGIYLDTDVELIKNLDDLLDCEVFFSCENDTHINTGLGFGAVKNNEYIKLLLESYNSISFVDELTGDLDLTPCTTRNTLTLKEKIGDIQPRINNKNSDKLIILGKEYFCPFNSHTGKMSKTRNTHGIHWFNASWRDKKINQRERLLRPIKRLIGVKNFNKIKGLFR